MSKIGVVDTGGGFRGVYATAVLDRCIDDGVDFDFGIGVSAGSGNIASYISGQKGRSYRFYAAYGKRPQYASIWNYLFRRSFIDMDYVYGTLCESDGEDPYDYEAMLANPMDFIVVAADANTGQAKYFNKDDIGLDQYDVFKASSSIPGICKAYSIGGTPYFDGALGDPIPVAKAFEEGCDKVVVLLTRPRDEIRQPGSDPKLAKLIERKYPRAAEAFRQRAWHYNASLDLAKQLEEQGRVLIVAPDDMCGVTTLSRDREAIDKLYAKGYADGAAIKSFTEQ